MDAQAIGIAAGIVSAAITGLGLLLNWHAGQERKHRAVLFAGGAGIVVVTIVAVGFTFALSARTREPPGKHLSKAQYLYQAGAICSRMNEEAESITRSQPQVAPFSLSIDVEKRAVERLKSLRPPDSLRSTHEETIAVWERRTNLLDSMSRQLPPLQVPGLTADQLKEKLQNTDALALQVTELFEHLGIPECTFNE